MCVSRTTKLTYLEAALTVLAIRRKPMTTRQLTEEIIERGLVTPAGRTPEATLAATLYRNVERVAGLERKFTPGSGRAARGSVRWIYRRPRSGPSTCW
jgi:hypothetical protein